MQFRDLKRQYDALQPAMDNAIHQALHTSHFIMGEEVRLLEQRLADYVGVRHCVACASGTDALRLSMMIAGIGEGDAVFVPDFTFYATAEVVLAQGATPIFIDVDPYTYNIDVDDLSRKVTTLRTSSNLRPRAIIAVDLFGLPADHESIAQLARQENLMIVEDAAQGFGGTINGRRACSFGHMAATSFFPAKPLGCYGDGGAFFTNSDDYAQQARSIIQHGKGSNKYENVRLGMNSRLDTIQAAVLNVKMDAFDHELAASQMIANRYHETLNSWVEVPTVPIGRTSSWAQYTVRLRDEHQRDSVKNSLAQQGIPSMVYYPVPLHRQPVFATIGRDAGCPNADLLAGTVLSLPMHPYLTNEEVDLVSSAVIDALTNLSL